MTIHVAGILGLLAIFLVGTIRHVNLGALALVMTFAVSTVFLGENVRTQLSGFPVDLLVLLAGVTYLFGVATANGSVERIVFGAAALVERRRALIPWIIFVVGAAPAMAGALGSAGVALLAPLAMRLSERHGIDRRMAGLMVVHGAAAGNFSPFNVLGALVKQSTAAGGVEISYPVLFLGNAIANLVLAVVIFIVFGGMRLRFGVVATADGAPLREPAVATPWRADQIATLLAIAGVAVAAFVYGTNVGFAAMAAAVVLHAVFQRSSAGAERHIAWGVVLLVCGVVTYVAALQRFGTIDAIGTAIAGFGNPLMTALLICVLAAVTSAFASSAGIIGALIPLALPLVAGGEIGATGVITALALSATLVDATPFSTVGALVVANAAEADRAVVYRGLLTWGAVMVLISPLLTWLVFVVIGGSTR